MGTSCDITQCLQNVKQVVQGDYEISRLNVMFNSRRKNAPLPVYVDGKKTLHIIDGFCDETNCDYRKFLQYKSGKCLVTCENPAAIDPIYRNN